MVVNCSTATKLAFQTWRVYVLHVNAASVSIQLTSIAKKLHSGNAELTRGCPSFFCAWENVVEIGEELTEAKGANDDGLRFRSGMGEARQGSGERDERMAHPASTGDMEGAGRGARPAVESDAGAVAGGYGVGQ
jgi:hypothetical protein